MFFIISFNTNVRKLLEQKNSKIFLAIFIVYSHPPQCEQFPPHPESAPSSGFPFQSNSIKLPHSGHLISLKSSSISASNSLLQYGQLIEKLSSCSS